MNLLTKFSVLCKLSTKGPTRLLFTLQAAMHQYRGLPTTAPCTSYRALELNNDRGYLVRAYSPKLAQVALHGVDVDLRLEKSKEESSCPKKGKKLAAKQS